MMSTVGGLVKTDHMEPGKALCDDGNQYYENEAPLVFSERCWTSLHNAALAILHGMVNPLVVGMGMQAGSRMPNDYPETKLSSQKYVFSKF